MSSIFISVLNSYTYHQLKSAEFQLSSSNAKDSPRIIQSEKYLELKKIAVSLKRGINCEEKKDLRELMCGQKIMVVGISKECIKNEILFIAPFN